jgi:quercetin dioxygenase-like cupin family protein
MSDGIDVISAAAGEPLDLIEGGGEAYVVVGPRSGAEFRTMAVVRLADGASTATLTHPGEAVWYVVRGGGIARPEDGEELELDEGSMVHVEPGAAYALAAGPDGLEVIGGPSPQDPDLGTDSAPRREGARVRKFHRDRPAMKVPMISSDARLVVFPGVGAESANMNYVRLEPGEENVPHIHPESEDTIFILAGKGTVCDHDSDIVQEFEAGDMIHVPVGLKHAVRADRGVEIVSVGGPCPPDRSMLERARAAADAG